jgi:NHLM bacteriocin system ABC transporter peptidase/ATP-binding protein
MADQKATSPPGSGLFGRRVRTPGILQMEATECGAAALAIVLGYYGRFVPLETLRIDCGVSRNGSQAVNILKAARHHGMIAKGAQVEDISLLSHLDSPMILFWEFDHFVVLERISNGRFYLNDPASGRRWVDHEHFNKAFTGIVLLLEPGPDFRKQGAPSALLRPLLARLRGAYTEIGFVLLASIALVVPGLVTAGISKAFVDNVLIQGLEDWVYPLIIGLLITAALRGLLTWLQESALVRLQTKLSLVQATTFLWHILHLPTSFHSQRYTADTAERVDSNERVASLISDELTGALVGVLTASLYAAAMLILAWQVGVFAIVVAFSLAALLLATARTISDKSKLLLQQQGRLAGVESNGVSSIETLKGSGWENVFFKRWAGHHAQTINTQQQLATIDIRLNTSSVLLHGISTAFLLGYGSFLIMQGEMSVGTLVALQILLIGFLAPVANMIITGQQSQEIRGDILRLEDGLTQSPEHFPGSTRQTADPTQDRIIHLQVEDLTFGYSPVDGAILKNISFELTPGKKIAVVGETGSGKSTLSKLICRCYPAWSGRILVNGEPIDEVSHERLARLLALVQQEPCLFDGSVMDNLTLWTAVDDHEPLHRAIRDACLEETLSNRGGLQCQVREGGNNFSGGEKQRLEIARALVPNPSVLVLDEATASLDAATEQKLYENIERRGCSLLVITHRLRMLEHFDEILVMERGQIIERGTHQELLDLAGVYSRLFQAEEQTDG